MIEYLEKAPCSHRVIHCVISDEPASQAKETDERAHMRAIYSEISAQN